MCNKASCQMVERPDLAIGRRSGSASAPFLATAANSINEYREDNLSNLAQNLQFACEG